MKRAGECSFWRLNQKKGATYTIEFTFDTFEYSGKVYKGAVRAKLDSLSNWEYKECSEAKYALQFGERMIERQKKWR